MLASPRALSQDAVLPAGSGQPLETATQAFFERRFSHDFSKVRVHTDERAHTSALLVDAVAYTVGRDILFRRGTYQPGTSQGKQLLAHELAHVTQHSATGPGSGTPTLVPEHAASEREADTMASQALAGRAHALPSGAPARGGGGLTLSRKPKGGWPILHQHVLQKMIQIVKAHPVDASERLEALTALFGTVPPEQAQLLYDRLEPGAATDDFAQYFKDKFPQSRADGLAFLRQQILKAPAQAEAKEPAQVISGQEIGKNAAQAAQKLPIKPETGAPLIPFGQSSVGEGYMLNPKYWTVEYILQKGSAQKSFTASKENPSALTQMFTFLEGHPEWHNSTFEVRIKIGQYGASAAINDVWKSESADKYALDCLSAALLTQLRGIYLSYPAASRDADFERDYGSFSMSRLPGDQLPQTSMSKDMEVTMLPARIPLSDPAKYKDLLKPGDEIPLLNLFMPSSSAWRTENVIYLGEGKFFGHPIGSVTPEEYAKKIKSYVRRSYVDPEIGKAPPEEDAALEAFILQHSFIQSYSRPRTMSIPKAPPPSSK
ncbi:MAG: DUF4157 domain-containing protein [Myxococcaceae bacterium]|nr:DUF4157 domain-containing protein [Myxococcaceae bacterium]